jgi:NAD(P)-dependent dehydrogenase (short-subunit alcohol dehydrogenase family)
MTNTQTLGNKTFLVLGAAGRIGRAITDAILNAGGKVLALDSDAEGLEKLEAVNQPSLLRCLNLDMNNEAAIDKAFKDADNYFGSVDGAVNTAYPRNKAYGRHFFDVEYTDFCENLGLHLGGYFLFMKSCARYAKDNQKGFSLVNLSSIYGSITPKFDIYDQSNMTMPVEYAAIKSGLEHMTRYVNAYMKHEKIGLRANCVSPGGIIAQQDVRFLDRYNDHCLSKGMLAADDVVGSILFLLSDSSRHICGQNLIVDDGFSL